MTKPDYFYITTTLPYVNAKPHIGFALEITEADIIARYQKMLGKQVVFNTGTDEHGQKIYEKAQAHKLDPQEYCDQYAAKFADLKNLLNIDYSNFIRTTNPDHIQAAQHFWEICFKKGDIYKKNYKIKYCVGCELEKTDSELDNNRCPLHPNKELEIREEENYFFRFSNYQKQLLNFYDKHPNFVKPEARYNEIKAFVKAGLKDFSISRLKEKMPWGIPVPNDNEHVMYVWFDALINYISTLGWPKNQTKFENFWPGVQLCGKDNLRQQSAMWQAMLLSADLPLSKQILINGFISVDGQKMSKSLGNVISPDTLVEKYGQDATRYLLIKLGTFQKDMDVTHERLALQYNANLANGLGNLCSRVAKMSSKFKKIDNIKKPNDFDQKYKKLMNQFKLTESLDWIDDLINQADKYLSTTKPWKLKPKKKQEILAVVISKIFFINHHLKPFMPEMTKVIKKQFNASPIQAQKPLFPRVEV